ncbi:MAG: hypothetical protein IT522_09745 [Burkholderiales bacterium]|nr:hypothetical protein [Burkholderiales bacterium]
MPTARELLDQADALMRRNRTPQLDDIPVLTDVAQVVPEARVLRGRGVQARAPASAPAPDAPALPDDADSVIAPDEGDSIVSADEGGVPAAEDADDSVAMADEGDSLAAPDEGDSLAVSTESDSRVAAHDDSLVTIDEDDSRVGPEEGDSIPMLTERVLPARTAAVEVRDMAELEVASASSAWLPGPSAAAPSAVGRDDAYWQGVAEDVRMQVLQRIDIFTDAGLREQLAARLQPIVDRASADLVATINQHVGDLLRAYVAEAIEREIESWRRSH